MIRRPVNRLTILTQDDFARIHEASLKLLEDTGIIFHAPEGLEILKNHGAIIDGRIARLPRELVRKSLDTAPSSFIWEARNPASSVKCGDDGGVLIRPNSGCLDIVGADQVRRPGTLVDLINFQKLHQHSDVLALVGCIPIHPTDVPSADKHLHILYQTIKNTDKPLNANVFERRAVIEMLEMAEIAIGHPLAASHTICLTATPLSPLAYGVEVTESIIEYARRNQPIQVADCAMAGVTGPIDLMGMVVLQNVEILAGLVLIQCVNPGTPVIYGPLSTAANMKNGRYITGTPEMMLMNLANLQLAIEFYHLPTRAMCGMTDSKVVDYQAAVETVQNMSLGILGGAHLVSEAMGILSDVMAISFEKFLLDEEILRRLLCIKNGFDVSDEAMSMDVIRQVGPGGNYLLHPTTVSKCRGKWTPTVSDWNPYEKWQRDGAKDAVARAARRCLEILNEAPESLIDPQLDKDLSAYVAAHKVA